MAPKDFTPKEWWKVLESVGYPTDVVVIDFETYFDDDYHMGSGGDALSTIEYVQDSRFEILGCSFTMMHPMTTDYAGATLFQAGEEMVGTQIGCLQRKYGDDLHGCTVSHHNAPFDGMILSKKFGIFAPYVVDTAALARHWNSRAKAGLDEQCKMFGLTEKGDTKEFKGLTFRKRFKKPKGRKKGPKLPFQVPLITPEQVQRLAGYANNDAMRQWEVLKILLPKLSNPATELRLMKHTTDLLHKPTLAVDFDEGTRLVGLMNAEIDRVMVAAGADDRKQISGDISFEGMLTEALENAGDEIQKYVKIGKDKMLLAIAKDDPQRAILVGHADERVRLLMAARIALDSWPLHIGRVERIMRQARANAGILPVPLKYHGAHTGRASGGEKINLQNLGSRGHELVNAIRNMLISQPGYSLVIVDESAIEARVLPWIAGQWDLCDRFAKNEEVYCGFAAKVLGYPVRKPKKKGGIPSIEARMTWARNSIGKVGVLGCGYGMGTDRIFEYAGGKIDIETAEKIKLTYRAENPAIVAFWKDIEKAFIYTAKYKRTCLLPRGLRFDSAPDCDVVITLPNGRELKYHKVKLAEGRFGNESAEIYHPMEHKWEYTWGGSLTENVVQAMSRDILMEAMLRLEDLGHHTAHHIHDELVIVTPDETANDVLAIANTELARRPVWAPECPLASEGIVSKKYGKH